MTVHESDLSAAQGRDPAYVAEVRARLHRMLDLVREAETMPWDDLLTIIHEDNAFRLLKDVLPKDEGDALWTAFDAEMGRLYAIMHPGRDMSAY